MTKIIQQNIETTDNIGEQLKEARLQRKMSQENLADVIGVSFQQIQKYESGTNRISLNRLIDMCGALSIQFVIHPTNISFLAIKQREIKRLRRRMDQIHALTSRK